MIRMINQIAKRQDQRIPCDADIVNETKIKLDHLVGQQAKMEDQLKEVQTKLKAKLQAAQSKLDGQLEEVHAKLEGSLLAVQNVPCTSCRWF